MIISKAHNRRAFTLTELLVAIAALALLTTGIGKIFSSISSLVAIGSAESEINQVARALERQLRDDFESFNRMRPEETFLAIRMREIGNLDHNDNLNTGQGEIALYLNADDRDADRSDLSNALITSPYEEGSRAVTRRVDEIMFIGFNGANGYTSYQLDPSTTAGDSTAQYARIYYGHGLRTVPDEGWPPADPFDTNAPSVPTRWFIPDGDFGSSPNPVVNPPDPLLSQNRFSAIATTPSPNATGRNEFASEWTLGRQPMLLYGGEAAGYSTSSGTQLRPRIGARREFAPYIRDLENEQRISQMDDQIVTETDLVDDGFMLPDISNYRRIRDGRVDICAMSHLDVRRWLEGADPGVIGSGQPFSSGRLLNIMGADRMDPATANNPLWFRVGDDENGAAVQRAIAGMFTRIQMDPTPPSIARAPKPTVDPPQPEDAIMDLHAALASRCSNFEIAWGDGSTALQDIDFDGDNVTDIRRGETLWYDIRTLNPGSGNPIRSTYRNWSSLQGSGLINLQSRSVDLWNRTELTAGDDSHDPDDFLVLDVGRVNDSLTSADSMEGAGGAVPTANNGPVYSTLLTGGADNVEDEALVIFPFRLPSGNGWGEAWDKTILLRVRVTLHDSLNRLPEGKDFEFIFTLDPQGF